MIAADGEKLLAAIGAAERESWLAQMPAVAISRRLWSEQFTGEPGKLLARGKGYAFDVDVARGQPSIRQSRPYEGKSRSSVQRTLTKIIMPHFCKS